MDIKKELLREAQRKGMCLPNLKGIAESNNVGDLAALYLKTIDWALENNFPNLATLRRNFSDMDSYGIFVDKVFHGEELCDKQTYVFHRCSGHIKVAMSYNEAIIPMLYFANDCHLKITCEQVNVGGLYVPLYIFGDNTIQAEDSTNVTFRKYNFDLI